MKTSATMKILVTGSIGFSGSSVVRHPLQKTRHQTTNLDKPIYAGNLEYLIGAMTHPHYFSQVNIRDPLAVRRIKSEHWPAPPLAAMHHHSFNEHNTQKFNEY